MKKNLRGMKEFSQVHTVLNARQALTAFSKQSKKKNRFVLHDPKG